MNKGILPNQKQKFLGRPTKLRQPTKLAAEKAKGRTKEEVSGSRNWKNMKKNIWE